MDSLKIKKEQDVESCSFYVVAYARSARYEDYAITPGWGNDTVYRIGKRYVVQTKYGERVKTCMGSRVFDDASGHHPPRNIRTILWHDGTFWRDFDGMCATTAAPRPVKE
ncbi:MAG: hypothetical protein WC477_05460 [Patescibacteria group bacterium]